MVNGIWLNALNIQNQDLKLHNGTVKNGNMDTFRKAAMNMLLDIVQFLWMKCSRLITYNNRYAQLSCA